jgi:anaerobic selenocysteine-containing dehydrogenase
MKKKGVSRRDFLKTSGAGAAALTAVSTATPEVQAQSSASRTQVFAALGDTIIPSDPGDPGYRTLPAPASFSAARASSTWMRTSGPSICG